MPKTTVVNIRTCGVDGYDVYLGRANRRYGLPGHILANPYVIGRDGDRPAVIGKYRARLYSRPDLMQAARALRGKRLACWCFPDLCHCDVVAQVAEQTGAPE